MSKRMPICMERRDSDRTNFRYIPRLVVLSTFVNTQTLLETGQQKQQALHMKTDGYLWCLTVTRPNK
jgi:hypothetical protein